MATQAELDAQKTNSSITTLGTVTAGVLNSGVTGGSGLNGGKTGASAFAATFSHGTSWHEFAANEKIVFNSTGSELFNIGGDFNTTTNLYLVPSSGLYVFGWHIYTARNDASNGFQLIVDGDRRTTYGTTQGYFTQSMLAADDHIDKFSTVLNCTAGEEVWVESYETSDFHAKFSIFFGYQLT
jgi:flagellar hook protein FlgE